MTVYDKPLKLEDAGEGTFLETTYSVEQNKMVFRLKNANEKETKVWRYQHFYSHATYQQKRAVLVASLRKVQKMASDADQLHVSAIAKLREFEKLKYPVWMLKKACNLLGATTNEGRWIAVRNEFCG